MFDKIIAKLKGGGKTDNSDKTVMTKVHTGIVANANANADASKKRNSMIIRAIVILGLAYYGITEFVLKDNNQAPEAVAAVKPKKPKKPKVEAPKEGELAKPEDKKPTDVATGDSKPAEVSAGEVKPEEKKDNTVENKNPATSTVPVENVNITPKATETTPEVSKTEPKVEPTAEVKVEPKVEAKVETETKSVNLGEAKNTEKQIDKELDRLIDNDEKKDAKPSTAPPVDLKDKISVDDTYVDPPTYENIGRGLVYNCKEKFWVCVDKSAYVACNKNMKYNKSHAKKGECSTFNVYTSNEDCALMQKHNVSTSQSVEGCD